MTDIFNITASPDSTVISVVANGIFYANSTVMYMTENISIPENETIFEFITKQALIVLILAPIFCIMTCILISFCCIKCFIMTSEVRKERVRTMSSITTEIDDDGVVFHDEDNVLDGGYQMGRIRGEARSRLETDLEYLYVSKDDEGEQQGIRKPSEGVEIEVNTPRGPDIITIGSEIEDDNVNQEKDADDNEENKMDGNIGMDLENFEETTPGPLIDFTVDGNKKMTKHVVKTSTDGVNEQNEHENGDKNIETGGNLVGDLEKNNDDLHDEDEDNEEYDSRKSDEFYPYKYAVQKETSFYGLKEANDGVTI